METTPQSLLLSGFDRYEELIGQLLQALDNVSDGGKKAKKIILEITRHDVIMQGHTDKLIAHRNAARPIEELRTEIRDMDQTFTDFTRQLAQLEEQLHSATQETTLSDVDGKVTKQPFTVHEALVFAQRIALMSFAPNDGTERPLETHRHPHPGESMHFSRLHSSLAELKKASLSARSVKEFLRSKEPDKPLPPEPLFHSLKALALSNTMNQGSSTESKVLEKETALLDSDGEEVPEHWEVGELLDMNMDMDASLDWEQDALDVTSDFF